MTTSAPPANQITIPLTQAQFDACAARMRETEGVTISGKAGQIAKHGAVVQWRYDGTNVTASVLYRRPYDTLATVQALVQQWFKAS